MNPLTYFKAVTGAVGAGVFPPIVNWLVGMLPGVPANVQQAIGILVVALLTGGTVYATPNSVTSAPSAPVSSAPPKPPR